jgi:hypothetical protein
VKASNQAPENGGRNYSGPQAAGGGVSPPPFSFPRLIFDE